MEWMTSLFIIAGMLVIILISLAIRYISSPSDLNHKKEMTSDKSSVANASAQSAASKASAVINDDMQAPSVQPKKKVKTKVKPQSEPRIAAQSKAEAPKVAATPMSERDLRVNAVVKAYLDLIESNKASEIPALIRAKIGALASEDEAREAITLIAAAQNNNNPLNGQREAIERIGILTFFQRIRLREAMLGKVEEVIKELSAKS